MESLLLSYKPNTCLQKDPKMGRLAKKNLLCVLRKQIKLNEQPKNITCTLMEQVSEEKSNIVFSKLDQSKQQKKKWQIFHVLSSPGRNNRLGKNTEKKPEGASGACQGQQLEDSSPSPQKVQSVETVSPDDPLTFGQSDRRQSGAGTWSLVLLLGARHKQDGTDWVLSLILSVQGKS